MKDARHLLRHALVGIARSGRRAPLPAWTPAIVLSAEGAPAYQPGPTAQTESPTHPCPNPSRTS
jgi:hypothetical protein